MSVSSRLRSVAVLDVPDVPSADPQRLAVLALELPELITGTAQSDRNLLSRLLQHYVVPHFVRRSEDNCARHQATVPGRLSPGPAGACDEQRIRSPGNPPSRNAGVPLRKLALQVESCSPGLLRLARRSASGDCGLSAGVLPQGQLRHPSSLGARVWLGAGESDGSTGSRLECNQRVGSSC
jgi:hypothetical protein